MTDEPTRAPSPDAAPEPTGTQPNLHMPAPSPEARRTSDTVVFSGPITDFLAASARRRWRRTPRCRRRRRAQGRGQALLGCQQQLAHRDRGPEGHRPVHRARRVRLAHRSQWLRQEHAVAGRRRPDAEHGRDRAGPRQAGQAGAPRSRLRHGLPGAGPLRLAHCPAQRRAATRDHGHGQGGARGARRRRCSAWSSSRTSPTITPGSFRAGCSSARPSPGPWRSTPPCCSWTSPSGPSTR